MGGTSDNRRDGLGDFPPGWNSVREPGPSGDGASGNHPALHGEALEPGAASAWSRVVPRVRSPVNRRPPPRGPRRDQTGTAFRRYPRSAKFLDRLPGQWRTIARADSVIVRLPPAGELFEQQPSDLGVEPVDNSFERDCPPTSWCHRVSRHTHHVRNRRGQTARVAGLPLEIDFHLELACKETPTGFEPARDGFAGHHHAMWFQRRKRMSPPGVEPGPRPSHGRVPPSHSKDESPARGGNPVSRHGGEHRGSRLPPPPPPAARWRSR